MKLNEDVEIIKNIGPARANHLRRLGIYTVGDLIEHFPREYEDRSIITPIAQMEEGGIYTICGICGNIKTSGFRQRIVTRMMVKDDTGEAELIWFNQPYLKDAFIKGEEYYFTGRAEPKNKYPVILSPDYEKKREHQLNSARIVPIYPLTYKITQKLLRGLIRDAIDYAFSDIEEYFPEEILSSYVLMGRREAIENIHFPSDEKMFFSARRRLAFDELFTLQLSLMLMKGKIKRSRSDVSIKNTDTSEFILPFELTSAQKRVMEEIKKDLEGPCAMYRLIQGDVGSGKTAVAILSCYMAINNGYQAVLMAPTEVLAVQHFNSINALFLKLGIETVLLSGSLKKREKEETLLKIENNQAQMIIGTHALIQERVNYHSLGLVITDEQHRFGVKQRSALARKGKAPHVLVMSATPIPRSLALVLYGDMDVSVIDELPPGRKSVETFGVDSRYRERVYCLIKKEIERGRQAYIVCPAIEEGETLDIKSVITYAEEIKKRYLPEFSIELIHGKLKPSQKETIMDGFLKGEIDVLVATTVIEVGVNVPNATFMLIENAERFGLSQLHQLRGRVGRGSDKSYCVLISDSKSKITAQRIKAMTKTNDGFEIAELDLKLRGPGDFFGIRQHGLPELKIADIYKDKEILTEARKAAIWAYDNYDKYKGLKRRIEILMPGNIDI